MKYELKTSRDRLHTAHGQLPVGTTIAIVETNLPVGDVCNWMIHGWLAPVEADKTESEIVFAVRAEPVAVTSTEDAAPDEQTEEQTEADDDDEEPQPDEDEAPAAPEIEALGLDPGTVMAIRELGITTQKQLRAELNSGKKLKNIGRIRREEITSKLGAS